MITEEDKDKLIATLTLQLQEKEKEIEDLSYEKSIKHLSLNRDWANSESEEMQKHLTSPIFKDKFEVCCPSCGKMHEYEFKDIKYSYLFKNIYISCKSCPRSIQELNFPEQAISFYRTMYDLIGYKKHQDYLCYRNHISTLKHQDKISFAVEYISKFKDFILNNIYLTANGDEEMINKYVDNQIEELKKGMKKDEQN